MGPISWEKTRHPVVRLHCATYAPNAYVVINRRTMTGFPQ